MSRARLSAGDVAPPFTTHALNGGAIGIPAVGQPDHRWTLVSFLRYASCPMCNLRMRELARALPALRSRGIGLIVMLHSPAASALRFAPVELRPYVVADPQRDLYRSYGTEISWALLVRTALTPSFYVDFVKAAAFGFWGGRVDGSMASMPADFIVSSDGLIRACRYGKHAGDHLSVEEAIAATG